MPFKRNLLTEISNDCFKDKIILFPNVVMTHSEQVTCLYLYMLFFQLKKDFASK